jgi:hypothetical protein
MSPVPSAVTGEALFGRSLSVAYSRLPLPRSTAPGQRSLLVDNHAPPGNREHLFSTQAVSVENVIPNRVVNSLFFSHPGKLFGRMCGVVPYRMTIFLVPYSAEGASSPCDQTKHIIHCCGLRILSARGSISVRDPYLFIICTACSLLVVRLGPQGEGRMCARAQSVRTVQYMSEW